MKAVKINFAMITAVACLLVLMSVLLYVVTLPATRYSFNEQGETLEGMQSDARMDGQTDDMEGYGIILYSIGYLFSGLELVAFGFAIFIMLGFGIIIFVPALIARLIYKPPNKRLLAYRILMLLDCIILIMGPYQLFAANPSVETLIAVVIPLIVAVICMVNTFSKRIIMT